MPCGSAISGQNLIVQYWIVALEVLILYMKICTNQPYYFTLFFEVPCGISDKKVCSIAVQASKLLIETSQSVN